MNTNVIICVAAAVLLLLWWNKKKEPFVPAPLTGAKSGQMEITVKSVPESVAKIYDLVTKYSGSIVDSTVFADSAEMTLSVGAKDFTSALDELRALGTVDAESVVGQDVDSALETLNKMLASLQAHREIIQRMIGDAKTTSEDAVKLQQQLQKIQISIAVVESQIAAINASLVKSFIGVALYK